MNIVALRCVRGPGIPARRAEAYTEDNAMLDKTLACGEEQNTTNRFEECAAVAHVETENPFGSF